mgnify:FL=1
MAHSDDGASPPRGAKSARMARNRIRKHGDQAMSRVCELTGKGPMVGNNVSHANNKTKRRFLPNLQDVTLLSDVLGRSVRLRISTSALRAIDHRGGLDAFLARTDESVLSPRALKLKRQVQKAQGGAESSTA